MQASPSIWKKFKPLEKKMWQDCYKRITWELKQYPFNKKHVKIPKEQIHIMAHNIACEVVWSFDFTLKCQMKNLKKR